MHKNNSGKYKNYTNGDGAYSVKLYHISRKMRLYYEKGRV